MAIDVGALALNNARVEYLKEMIAAYKAKVEEYEELLDYALQDKESLLVGK